uniref:HTH araC/xylS-type domain-containing protein n=1 Tax=Pelagomonas calceolata TaxID=35677 RepID=A0A7S3ZYM0_9STRA|mmetsp:Transcript_9275/g.27209  ORF Transcript_9275/g.27209 Transcript_9275/m.27209 type:complete len:995 (-) Transcript_9275:45-3029(-)
MEDIIEPLTALKLRPKKLARLSGEQCALLRALASPAPHSNARTWKRAVQTAPKCDDATLSAALRRYDLDGYGLVRPGVFDLALDACGINLDKDEKRRFFESLDYARCNRCDAEVLVALCAHWRRSPLQEERTPLAEINATYDHEAQCFLADARAFKKRLADACERLDVSGLGALHGDAFSLACRDAGLAAPSKDVLKRVAPPRDDGRHDYRLLLDLDGADAERLEHHAPGAGVWREAEEVWPEARAFYVDASADGLGAALARAGLPLGSDDVLGLWRAAGRRGDCSLASLDRFFRLPPTKEKPPKVPTCVREEAPFACGGDPRNLWQPRRPPSRTSGVWRADEETEGAFDGWNHLEMVEKRPASKGDFAVCPPSPKRKSETHFLEGKVVPPFWTADAPPPPPPHGCGDHTTKRHIHRGVREPSRKPFFGGPTVEGAGSDRMEEGLGERTPELARRMRQAAQNDEKLASTARSQFRTGPSSLSRGEISGLAQHLGCVPFTAADVDRVERWLASGIVHSNVVYDVDGRVLQERDDSLRALLGLERQGHLEEAAACRERAARLRGRRGFSAISASARRACYRVLRASDAVSRKCEAADAEGFGYCGTRALDAALRADALVSDAKDREDICDWCAVEGKVDYAALYETLSRVLAEDRRLRKDLDVPKKTSNRLTQDSLAVKYDAAHTPLLPGWVGSDGQPPNKGRRMVDVDISNRAGAVGGFSSDGSFAIAQKRHFGSDPKRYHRHFDDGDEFGDGLVPQEHARHYREGVAGGESLRHFHRYHGDGDDLGPSLVPNEEHSLVDEVGRAGQRNQTHYHRHYYDGDQLHMRWETATPEKRIRPMVDALPADPSLIARAAGAEEFRGDDLDAREKRLEARKSGRRSPVDVRNSVRDKLKNSVAFSGNAQTAAVRLRHAFKRHARRGVSAGGGALLLLGARGMVGSGAGAVAAPTDVGQVLRELGVELDESELEALLGEVQGNAVPVEAVVRDVARCVAGVC